MHAPQGFYPTLSTTRRPRCTAQHCAALRCTACAALYCTALRCTALHYAALHYAALHYAALHYAALRCIAPVLKMMSVSHSTPEIRRALTMPVRS